MGQALGNSERMRIFLRREGGSEGGDSCHINDSKMPSSRLFCDLHASDT